jgi:putative transposase
VGDGRDRAPHRTGKVYLAVVLDAWSPRLVGWSIADHMRAELIADAALSDVRLYLLEPTASASMCP